MTHYTNSPYKNRAEYLAANPDVRRRLKRDEALTAGLVREARSRGVNLKQPSSPGRQRL